MPKTLLWHMMRSFLFGGASAMSWRLSGLSAFAMALAACSVPDQDQANPDSVAIVLAKPIESERGVAWMVDIPVDPDVRKFRLFENDQELGPGDSLHDDIRTQGLGRYSHWKTEDGAIRFYFSTSDNSDPNTNGRTYDLK
jgi:hypothetical protein